MDFIDKISHIRGTRKDHLEEGFSLIELLVTILILGILSAAAIPVMVQARKEQEGSDGQAAPEPTYTPPAAPVEPGPSAGDIMAPILGVTGAVVGIVLALALMFGVFMFFKKQVDKVQSAKVLALNHKKMMGDLDARFEQTVLEIGKYETDPGLAIDYPAFNDVTVPEVSAMIKAMGDAKNQRTMVGDNPDAFTSYQTAVVEFEVAFQAAKRSAERIAWKSVSPEEQRELKRAKQLLAHASDPGNTEEARATYRSQLAMTIQRINRMNGSELIPAKMVEELEAESLLAIMR